MKKMTDKELRAYKLAPNFSLREFTYDSLAAQNGLDNIPGEEGIEKLRRICTEILQPVRNHFGKPVIITYGYLCPQLCALHLLPELSLHSRCEAVDFWVRGVNYKTVTDWIAAHCHYDLLMWEFACPNDQHLGDARIHVSYISPEQNRGYNLTTDAGLKAYKLSKNFSLFELTYSATARRRKLFNVPDELGIEKLKQLCEHVLQPVRDHFGKPVRVNSGYRSNAVNAAIKGSARNSQHKKCEAADYEIIGLDNHDLAHWVGHNLVYDQLILEYHGDDSNDPNDGWVHTSYVAPPRKNRNQKLTIDKKGTRAGIAKG